MFRVSRAQPVPSRPRVRVVVMVVMVVVSAVEVTHEAMIAAVATVIPVSCWTCEVRVMIISWTCCKCAASTLP
ncbi:conserved hypothetical protein [Oceanicaulis sp. 350]|nr:conserved hypothetical protein [Oceanicaulis sp. 350]